MTHRGMFSGLSADVGIIMAIRAIRHMWSDMLSASMTPSRTHPDRFSICRVSSDLRSGQWQPSSQSNQLTFSRSRRCRNAKVSTASLPVDLSVQHLHQTPAEREVTA